MNTLKNFLMGLFVIVAALVIFSIVMLIKPLLIGIGSVLFSIIAFILFFVFMFYVVVFIGYLARQVMKK